MKNVTITSILLAAVLVSACSSGTEEKKEDKTPVAPAVTITQVVGQARIEPEDKIANLATPVSGIVKTVYKQENDVVKQGEVIVELVNDIEKAKLAQVQSRIKMQGAKIEASEFDLAEINTRLANKEKELGRLTSLLAKGSETQQRVDDVQTEYNVLKTSSQRAAANLAMARAELTQLQNERDLAQVELNQKFIKAPSTGRLISITAVPGGAIQVQNSFAEFAPEGRLIARAEVDELFASQIEVGQSASIRLLGKEQVVTTGKVIYAASSLKRKSLFSEKAGDQEDRRVREIKVLLDDPKALLINARVECVIQIGK